MTPQDGDHFVENTLRIVYCDRADCILPDRYHDGDCLTDDARAALYRGEATFATPIERHLGLPSRDRVIEDRAQEARRGARLIRQRTYDDRIVRALDPETHFHELSRDDQDTVTRWLGATVHP